MDSKPLFELTPNGDLQRVRGVDASDDSHLMRVLAEGGNLVPPKETDWVVGAARRFAKRLQAPSGDPEPTDR